MQLNSFEPFRNYHTSFEKLLEVFNVFEIKECKLSKKKLRFVKRDGQKFS